MNEARRRHDLSRLILGLAVCGLGILFTLDHMGWFDAGSLFDYWPLLLVAIGLSRLLQAPGGQGRGVGLVLVLVGTWWVLYNLGIVNVSVWRLWPGLLLLIGAGMVWKAVGGGRHRVHGEARPTSGFDAMAPPPVGDTQLPPPPPLVNASSDDVVNGLAMLGGYKRVVTSKRFQGGSLTAFMGGVEVDLRQAEIDGDYAAIETLAIWGGIEIRVPESWAVEVTGTPILGGFEDKTTRRHGSSAKTLIIRGFAIMGGVEIKD